jgi:20S proteasome subunit beta 1
MNISSSMAGDTDGEHMMGTTIMAVTFDGGVVLGADSRTSTGTYVANRVSDKITPISEHIYCCRSGSASDTQAISEIVKYYMSIHKVELGTPPLVKTAVLCTFYFIHYLRFYSISREI